MHQGSRHFRAGQRVTSEQDSEVAIFNQKSDGDVMRF
jgi:hypothetical protein